jgi:multicomponent Na+:H+ antiporter subunit G
MSSVLAEWNLYAAALCLLVGAAFILLAAIGVYRMPDVYLKCHTASKASTMGKIFMFSALAFYFWDFSVLIKAMLIVLFFFLTTPVSTHLFVRAARRANSPRCKETVLDADPR